MTTSAAPISYRAPQSSEHAVLRAMARQSFVETFGHLYERESFERFLDESYAPGGTMARDLADPAVDWLVAFDEARPIGYVKLTSLRVAAPGALPGAVQLQQLYVLAPWQGRGVAARLMDWAVDVADRRDAPEVFLTVWENNERAKRFYTRYGFTDVGQVEFRVGDQVDHDRILRRPRG